MGGVGGGQGERGGKVRGEEGRGGDGETGGGDHCVADGEEGAHHLADGGADQLDLPVVGTLAVPRPLSRARLCTITTKACICQTLLPHTHGCHYIKLAWPH